ncbi:MAG: domain S-box, partial [Myxococcaceae bacterium]|nr:domain S-box [Myxococcaceae bacterium]
SADEVVGRNFSLFFTADDQRAGKPQFELERAKLEGRFEEEGFRVRRDGSKFWAGVVVTPVRDREGRLLGFAKVMRDLTAHKEAESNAQRLATERAAREAAEAAEARLRDSEARYRALSQRLEIILEGLADGVAAQHRDGRLIFANKAGAVAMGFPSVEACMAATLEERANRFELLDEHGAPVQVRELPGQRVLRGEPACSMLVHVRDRDTGQEWWRHLRATGVLGQDGQPEIAIYIWHDVTEARRREQHESYLARATAALAESLDYQSTLSTLASLLVPGLGDWCSIHLRTGNQVASVAVAHVDPDKVKFAREMARRYPPDPQQQSGVWNVLRTGTSELYTEISEELLAQGAQDAEHLRILREAGMRSVLIVPIRTRQRVVGTLSLVSAEAGRRYNQHDLSLAEELGRRAGNSIENARLYAAQKKAREDLALLARAGESFSSAASYEELLERVANSALPALGDFAIVELADSDAPRTFAAAYDDPELDALLKATAWGRSEGGPRGSSALSSDHQTRFVPVVDDAWLQDAAFDTGQLQALEQTGLCSLVSVPMRTHGRALGSLTVCYGKSGSHYSAENVGLIEELARRAAIAITQVQLYTRAQEAAKSAEEANRLKDEFLATVSHELRTPLNAMLGWASVLRTRTREPTLVKPIEVIHRNALAQGKIIEDILDASRAITGKLRLDLKETDLAHIIRASIDVLRPSITAKQIAVEFAPTRQECLLVADPDRIQQVVWNVLSNAVKFSDPGGRVLISLSREGEAWVLSVRDTGRGIAADFLPFVFDRFKQEDGSTTRRVGGLGLGLAIARHIVELHGGHVEAMSPGVGQGATFRVSLPIGPVAFSPSHGESVRPPSGTQASSERARVLEGVRVLVVDDEEDVRELLLTALGEAGALVQSEASAAEGFAAVARFRPHVLVSDIGMPQEDGCSFVQRVRALAAANGGATPAIALSAYTRAPDKDRALSAGFDTYVCKPVLTDELIAAIDALAGPTRADPK